VELQRHRRLVRINSPLCFYFGAVAASINHKLSSIEYQAIDIQATPTPTPNAALCDLGLCDSAAANLGASTHRACFGLLFF
jgi:hypothetical protein